MERETQVTHQAPEREERPEQGYSPAVPVRLLVGGQALNPDNVLGDVHDEDFGTFEERSYDIFNRASTSERQTYWQNRQGDRLAQWKTNFHNSLTSSQEFFTNSPDGRRWTQFFSRLGGDGVRFDVVSASEGMVEGLYSRYFDAATKESNTKQFVEDVLSAHREEGRINYELFVQNMDVIHWTSRMFGERSSDVVSLIAQAEAMVTESEARQRALAIANHSLEISEGHVVKLVNVLSPHDQELLRFIWERRERSEHQRVQEQILQPQPQVQREEETEDHTPEEIADRLLTYETGEPREHVVDLSESFPQLVERVGQLVFEHPEAISDTSEVLIVSDATYQMVKRVAGEANRVNRELGFTIQGVALERHPNVRVGAYIVPVMDFRNAQEFQINIDPGVYRRLAPTLAQNTRLQDYFSTRTMSPDGEACTVGHIHQIQTGLIHRGQYSQGDIRMVEERIRRGEDVVEWAVFTLDNGALYDYVMQSQKQPDGSIVHKRVQLIKESDLDNLLTEDDELSLAA